MKYERNDFFCLSFVKIIRRKMCYWRCVCPNIRINVHVPLLREKRRSYGWRFDHGKALQVYQAGNWLLKSIIDLEVSSEKKDKKTLNGLGLTLPLSSWRVQLDISNENMEKQSLTYLTKA